MEWILYSDGTPGFSGKSFALPAGEALSDEDVADGFCPRWQGEAADGDDAYRQAVGR